MPRKGNRTGYKTVNFDATKPIREPVNVRFKTKEGKTVTFPATKIVKKTVNVKFKAKK